MHTTDFSAMTVIELRKYAKEHGISIGARMNKADIVAKLEAADGGEDPVQTEQLDMALPVEKDAPGASDEPEDEGETEDGEDTEEAVEPEKPVRPEEEPVQGRAGQPQFKAAWHNPSPRYGVGYGRNTAPARPTPAPRSDWREPQDAPAPRPAPARPGQIHRFGPAPAQEQEAAPAPGRTAWREEQPQEGQSAFRPAYDSSAQQPFLQRRNYGSTYTRSDSGAVGGPRRSFGVQQGSEPGNSAYRSAPQAAPQQTRAPMPQQETAEWTNPADLVEGSGVLDMHPDGYGYLRGPGLLASGRDIYIGAAQCRRFSLRPGDVVSGKVRPQREGEKYATMLTVGTVNGVPAEAVSARPSFDDDTDKLQPDYPVRKINLDMADRGMRDMRVLDLLCPIGFGQRALLLCQPDTHRNALLRNFANALQANHPDAEVFIVLNGGTPEDATRMRDHVSCHVLAATFDQPSENQLRLCDLLLEYAKRRVEMKKDVVLIVDSLTRLSKAWPTSAALQGRATPGAVNPGSLNRAKKLFGSANSFRSGGSLTVLGVMTQDASRVDDAIFEEFRAAANAVITLDTAVARAGVYPAINPAGCGMRHPELMLSQQEMESLRQLKAAMGGLSPASAISQLLNFVDRVPTNAQLREKLPEWLALMRDPRTKNS